jgi:hypothetical protein
MPGGLTGKMRGLLLGRSRTVMIAVGAVAALLVISSRMIDSGEIVELTTLDDRGRDHVTEVWIVDLPSGSYLRSGDPESRWLTRIRANPEISLEREGRELRYRAVPSEEGEVREQVNAAMAEKYGGADQFWVRVSNLETAVPIRLVPADVAVSSP